jgi:branched-chain amino acid transport system substrate-binding protein
MRTSWWITAIMAGMCSVVSAGGQAAGTWSCSCGAHPPGPPKDRDVEPYAGQPADLSPFEKYAKPYFLNYVHPNIYSGAGRDIPEPKDVSEVRIGFIGPIEGTSDAVFGKRMLHGAQLAVDEANAQGGYGGKPFHLILHDDYNNWQEKAVSGSGRRTDPAIWGSASDVGVKMIYDEQDWAIFGSINSETTHILLRLVLKAETPIVNSASTDPTIPETYIPWYFTDLQDDRVQSFTLARRIYSELGLKRTAILRVNNRYGRMGVPEFRNAARRLGHPIVIEQKYLPGDTDFSRELRIIRDSRVDSIVLWADEDEAASILKEMKTLGMKQHVFGSYRTLGTELLAAAGPAAEGFEAVFPYDPTRKDPKWISFNQRFEARYHEPPDQFASLSYDAMNILLHAICEAGLNRARIHDALADLQEYDGVTGHMVFDPNQKNVAPMYIGTVHNGSITYKLTTMNKVQPDEKSSAASPASPLPYARVGEDGVEYLGPQRPNEPAGPVRIVLFGPDAADVAASPALALLVHGTAAGRKAMQLIPVASNQTWGAAATQLVHALWDEHALAVLALDRDSAHLSEQLALKAFVPVLGLSDDTTLTSTNIPWIFRLPASTKPSQALQLIESAVAQSGDNPERLRDILASGHPINGLSFTSTGELQRR